LLDHHHGTDLCNSQLVTITLSTPARRSASERAVTHKLYTNLPSWNLHSFVRPPFIVVLGHARDSLPETDCLAALAAPVAPITLFGTATPHAGFVGRPGCLPTLPLYLSPASLQRHGNQSRSLVPIISQTTMSTGTPSSRLSVAQTGRGRRRSGHTNAAIIDIDPIILRERERMENERMQRESEQRHIASTSASSSTMTLPAPPPHYSHQTLLAARRPRTGERLHPLIPPSPLAATSLRDPTNPLTTADPLRRRTPTPPAHRERTSSPTMYPYSHHHQQHPVSHQSQQHHRLPTTSAAPIASAAQPHIGPSSTHSNYPGATQPSVMALPPGSAARIVDGPSGTSSAGAPPSGSAHIPSGGPSGPSVAGHHPHQVQPGMHPAHDNGGPGHDKMNMLLGEIRSEYEALQTDCIVLKGQRDEYESKSEWPIRWLVLFCDEANSHRTC
jgi:hypothetical protein